MWLSPQKNFKQKIFLKMIQKRDGSSYEGGSSGGGGTCLESAYILKVELTEFADGLGVGRER